MGNYRNRNPGDQCGKCRVGFMERIVIQPTAAESIFCLATLGLGGDGGSQYFKCSTCHTEYDNRVYDSHLAEDKPYTVKDYIEICKFILVMLLFAIVGYLSILFISWIIGSMLK